MRLWSGLEQVCAVTSTGRAQVQALRSLAGPPAASQPAPRQAGMPPRPWPTPWFRPTPGPAPPCAGVPMVPISWQEMQCPQTKAVEHRKVAKLEQ